MGCEPLVLVHFFTMDTQVFQLICTKVTPISSFDSQIADNKKT